MALVPIALVAALVAAWFYRASRSALTPRDQMVLGGLRIAAISIVALCLARPVLAVSRAIEQRNVVGIVIDDSRSTRITDHSPLARGSYGHQGFGGPGSALLKALREEVQRSR